MTRLLIPLVAAVTLALLLVWLQQRPAPPAPADAAPATAAAVEAPPAVEEAPPADEEPPPAVEEAPPADVVSEPPASEPEAVAEAAPADDDAAEAAPEAAPEEETPEAAGPPVPEGYAVVPPLSAERRLAFDAADDVLDPDLDYAAVIETNRGVLVVDLFETETPVTVNNFVFLARHLFYDGIVFHRVIDGFMAQTGDPTGTGTGGPGYRFADEIVDGLRHDAAGVLSMANSGPGTNGSQFFLTFDATPWLDGAHTVFGRVVEGVEVLDDITRVDPQQPVAWARMSDPAEQVRAAGIDLPGDATVLEALTDVLGAEPVPGPGYEVAGVRVAVGTVAGEPAVGFFARPDRMERVTIVARER